MGKTGQGPRVWLGRLLMACLWLALIAAPDAVSAETPVRFAVYVDETANRTVDDLQQLYFRPIQSIFGGGFTRAVYWVQVSFDTPAPGPMQLRFRPTTTDSITLYTPGPDGGWQTEQNGELTAPDAHMSQSIGWYAFLIDPSKVPGPYYVRIRTDSPGAISVTTVLRGQIVTRQVQAAAWHGVNYALQVLAMVLMVALIDPFRSRSNFSFLAMGVSFSIYLYVTNGYFRMVFQPGNPVFVEAVQELLAVTTVAALATFHHLFLQQYRPATLPRLASGSLVMMAWTAVLARLAGEGLLSLRIALPVYVLLVPVLLAMLLTMRNDAPTDRGKVRLVYAIYIGFLSLNIAARLGLIHAELLYRHSVEAITAVTSTLILTLVWIQERKVREEALQREVDLQAISVEMQLGAAFRASQTALIQRIESKAQPVFAQIGKAMDDGLFPSGSAQVERSVRALHEVIDRCLLAHRAEKDRWNLQSQTFLLHQLLAEVAQALDPAGPWSMQLKPLALTTDRTMFEMAARNLLANAKRYGAAGRPVDLCLHPATREGIDGVEVQIVNHSAMADPFDPARVFDKFYRGKSAGTNSGTGLGLFIAREAIRAMSGHLEMTVEPLQAGARVTVTVWMPVTP